MSDSTTPTECIIWGSVCPTKKIIDIYPDPIARKLENHLRDNTHLHRLGSTACPIKEHFNATVHFTGSTYYQTTPGSQMGRYGFKQPGYRSVFRMIIPISQNSIEVMTKSCAGEQRIAYRSIDNERTLYKELSYSDKTLLKTDNFQIASNIGVLTPDLLISDNDLCPIAVWQWCIGSHSSIEEVLNLSDNHWKPYLQVDNAVIEDKYQDGQRYANIQITDIGNRDIKFEEDSMWALQCVPNDSKVRIMRRKIITLGQHKRDLEKIKDFSMDIGSLIDSINWETTEAPDGFLCSITQTVMQNPVKTVDGHIYEKAAIERWFTINNTSPLTGLALDDLRLTECSDLKTAITNWLESIGNQNLVIDVSNEINNSVEQSVDLSPTEVEAMLIQ